LLLSSGLDSDFVVLLIVFTPEVSGIHILATLY
jgi:hypothetical protein